MDLKLNKIETERGVWRKSDETDMEMTRGQADTSGTSRCSLWSANPVPACCSGNRTLLRTRRVLTSDYTYRQQPYLKSGAPAQS